MAGYNKTINMLYTQIRTIEIIEFPLNIGLFVLKNLSKILPLSFSILLESLTGFSPEKCTVFYKRKFIFFNSLSGVCEEGLEI